FGKHVPSGGDDDRKYEGCIRARLACGAMPSPMMRDVTDFVEGVAGELSALSGKPASAHTEDAVIEASNLVAAVIAADGRLTDMELDAYLDSIGPLLDPPLLTSAAHIRDTDLFH